MAKSIELLSKIKSLTEESKFRDVIDLLTEKQLDKLNDPELYFYRSWAHYQLGETESAKVYSEKALEKKPGLQYELNIAGNNFYAQNEYKKAIIEYDKAIFLDPNFTNAYCNKGLSLYNLGEYDHALANFNKSISLDNNFVDAYLNRGRVWHFRNEYDNAIAEYTEAINIDGNYTIAYYNRGLAWYALKKYKQAISDFSKTIELDKNYYLAYGNRGLAFYSMKEYESAELDFSKAISIKHDYKDAFLNRGLVWYYKNDFAKAIADFDSAIELDKDYSLAFSNRGLAWYNMLDYEKAISDYDQAILLKTDNKDAFLNRGLAWYYKNDFAKAIADWDKAIELDESYVIAYNNRGLAWQYLGDYNKAIDDYNKAIALDPIYSDAFINRGIAYYYKGQFDKAIEDYKIAIEQNEKHAYVYFNIGLAYFSLGDFTKAIENQNLALELQENYPDAYNIRGNAYYFAGDLDKAEKDFEEVSKSPGYEDMGYANLGDVCSSRGEFQKAGDFYVKAKGFNNDIEWLRKHLLMRIEINEQRLTVAKTKITNETLSQAVRIEDWIDNTLERIKKHSKSDAQHVVHYTKLFVSDIYVKTLYSKMQYSNALYLNDPMEGKILFKYFDDDKITQAYINGEKRNESSVYLGSFLPAEDLEQRISFEDELVMWRTYGKDANGKEAAGCSIVLSSDFFKQKIKPVEDDNIYTETEKVKSKAGTIKDSKVGSIKGEDSTAKLDDEELLKVIYIKTTGFDRTIMKDNDGNIKLLLDELKGYLQSLIKIYDENNEQRVFLKYVENTIFKKLSRINFLFKSADYNFENEVRVIRYVPRDSNLIQSKEITEPNLPPKRFYIESSNYVLPHIRKIYLGPKVENHQHWGLYFDFEIRQREKDLKKLKSAPYELKPSDIQISKSECEFQ